MTRRARSNSEETRLRKNRDQYRELYHQEKIMRKVATERAKRLQVKLKEQREITGFAAQRLRRQSLIGQALIAGLVLTLGLILSSRKDTQVITSTPMVPMASEANELPPLGGSTCIECQPNRTEDHILASVKMQNGGIGCSGTVIGDPRHFREFPEVLVVSAAHCVVGKIGGKVTFYNPDGKTSFEATLLGYDRKIDAALFSAPSSSPLAAVLMAAPGTWDQRAKFSSCNYPAASGGPNYKFCTYAGTSYRQGADPGNLFSIDKISREHDGYHSNGGSGGGLFVQPSGSRDWLFFGATTHGSGGTQIATPSHGELFAFIDDHAPSRDRCGPWGCSRPKQPKEPGEGKPPWYNPNIPVDPPPVAPPAPPDENPPAPIEPPKPSPEVISRIEKIEKEFAALILKQGPQGPQGPAGPPGNSPTVDYDRLKLEVQAIARSTIEAMIASGGLKGPKGDPGDSPQINPDEIAEDVLKKLPPVSMILRKDGKDYPNEKPLGQPLVLEFSGGQIKVSGN